MLKTAADKILPLSSLTGTYQVVINSSDCSLCYMQVRRVVRVRWVQLVLLVEWEQQEQWETQGSLDHQVSEVSEDKQLYLNWDLILCS